MPKKRARLTRLGLPEKSEKVNLAVTSEEKASIQEAARSAGRTVSAYLLGLHHAAQREKGGKS